MTPIPSANYKNDRVTTLKTSMTSATQTPGITLNAIKDNNGTAITWGITGAQLLRFSRRVKNRTVKEYIYAPSATINGTTFVITLGTVTRDVGDDLVGDSNGVKWPSGTSVELVWAAQQANQTAFIDQANTFSDKISFTGTTHAGIGLIHLTTGERDILTAVNGDLIYNITTSQVNQYIGGAWTAVGNTGTAAMTSTSAGTGELAVAADMAASTGNGSSGAPVVVPTSLVVKTSSGAGDENKIPVLNASGQMADGYLGTGTASASNVLLGNRTWGTFQGSADKMFGVGSDGVPTWTSGASLDPATEKGYTTATLPVSQTLTVSTVNVPLIIHNTSDVVINGTVDLNGKGGAAGAGGARCTTLSCTATAGGAGAVGGSLISGWTTAGGGSGGAKASGGNGGSGGGGGSALDSGSPGTVGNSSGGAAGTVGGVLPANQLAFLAGLLRSVCCGAGGAGGGGGGRDGGSTANSYTGGNGGAGGGSLVWFIGGNLTLGASSIIRANGAVGSADTLGTDGYRGGGGGGGGGGTILIIVSGTITNSGATVSATGGTGGVGGVTGGPGAAGRVIIYSLSTGTLITA